MTTALVRRASRDVDTVAPVRWWHRQSPCRILHKLEWFPDDDIVRPSAAVQRVCDECPFQRECLADALEFVDTDGVRGGTTRYQRDQLRRERERARCPGCGSDAVVPNGRGEVCISCGVSWLV